MKTSLAVAVVTGASALFLAPGLWAGLISESYHFTGPPLPLTPPDSGATPVSDTRTISASAIVEITDVNIAFTLAGAGQGAAFNGDFYMTLQHDSGFAVLLNRVGRRAQTGTIGETLGYSDNGFNVTLDDQTSNGDIHLYRATLAGGDHTVPVDPNFILPLTGTWAPDGRNISPLSVLASSDRTATLSVFNNLPVNGSWTLQIVDLNGGGVATLTDWTLSVAGTAVPEPGETVAMAAGVLVMFVAARRRWRKPVVATVNSGA